MVEGFGKELVKLLKEAGCSFKHEGKGSHQVWYSPITKKTIAVPMGTASKHTANDILKDAGIKKKL
jgi:predicted RNA binding protein YcfA (HicA-like mRNA interferase family)